MDVDVLEGLLRLAFGVLGEMQAHHHHPGDPEEDDVEAGDQRRGRVVAGKLRRLFRPAQRRERPQRRGEPGVEHVLVARQVLVLAVVGVGGGLRLRLVVRDEHLAVRPVPRRDLVAPPELARDAPRLDVLHPVEIGLLPARRDDRRAPLAHRGDGRLGQRLGVDVPLVGEVGLDRRAAAVAMRDHVDMVLDLLDQPPLLHHLDDALAGGEAIEAIQRLDRLLEFLALGHAFAGRRHSPSRTIFASGSRMLIAGRLWRLPTSKSLKSCAGVIFTAPVPVSGSA